MGPAGALLDISVGSGVLWLSLAQGSTIGLLVAIGVSAYLGSGLLAAPWPSIASGCGAGSGATAPARAT